MVAVHSDGHGVQGKCASLHHIGIVSIGGAWQSALAPSSIAVLSLFFAYGMPSTHGIPAIERRYLALIGLVFILIPALVVATENFRARTSRFLSYLIVPFVLIAARGVVAFNRLFRAGRVYFLP